MKNLQKVLVFVTILALALGMVLGLVSCNENNTNNTDPTTVPTTVPTTAPTTPVLTAEQVYTQVGNAMQDTEATRMKMKVFYELTVTEGEGDAATTTMTTVDMVVDSMFSEQPFASYTLMDLSLIVDDVPFVDYTMKVYMVEEKKSVVTYMQLLDNWTRTDSGMSVSDFLSTMETASVDTSEIWNKNFVLSNMTLEKGSLNGKEVYILRGNRPVNDMDSVLEDLGIADTSAYEKLTLPVAYYVDTQSFLVLRSEVNMASLGDLLSKDLAGSQVNADAEGTTITLNIPDICYDLEYGKPPIPAVPQEAYDATGSSKGHDGPLVLNRDGDAYMVACPKEMIGEYISDSNVRILAEDNSLVADYYFYSEFSKDEVMNLVQSKVDSLKGDGIFLSQGEGPNIDHFETWQVVGNGHSYYFAWREAGDGWMLLIVCDYTGTGTAADLLPQFVSYLSPYGK